MRFGNPNIGEDFADLWEIKFKTFACYLDLG